MVFVGKEEEKEKNLVSFQLERYLETRFLCVAPSSQVPQPLLLVVGSWQLGNLTTPLEVLTKF